MRKTTYAIVAWAIAGAIYVATHRVDTQFAMYWIFGLGFGFVLQRGRFCFASAFRDLFLLGYGRNMKGVLVGLAVASIGFGLVMSRQVPMAYLGILPPSANVLPLGVHTALGGLLFGVGMVLAGGCVSGSIYRMGEGYVGSWVAFAGVMGGLLASSYTWNWWWDHGISTAPRWWLPNWLGHPGALVVTLVALAAVYLWVVTMEQRAGMVVPRAPRSAETPEGVRGELGSVAHSVFVEGWAIIPAGAVLGGLNVLLFTAQEP
ncbi:MAG: YeeE/YedE thiosulfate transporter family protein, partial [Gemmatimonadota bacterium]